jgi:ATP-dependent exoDNAse (exonuclease V) beta subunit
MPPFAGPLGEDRSLGGGSSALGRAVGLTAHHALEIWDRGDDAALLAGLRAAAARAAATAGAVAEEVERDTREVLSSFLGSALARRLRELEHVEREVPILLRGEDGQTWSGRIDLLARAPDGAWIVVDFKTDAGASATEIAARYRPQMAVYAAAVRRALALPSLPRCEVWLLRAGEAIVVDPAEDAVRLKLMPARG